MALLVASFLFRNLPSNAEWQEVGQKFKPQWALMDKNGL
jgi:hypothetical protein